MVYAIFKLSDLATMKESRLIVATDVEDSGSLQIAGSPEFFSFGETGFQIGVAVSTRNPTDATRDFNVKLLDPEIGQITFSQVSWDGINGLMETELES